MSLPKGRTNNPNGRPKFMAEKRAVAKEKVTNCIVDITDDMIALLDSPGLTAKEKLDIYIKLLAFVIPKPSEVKVTEKHLPKELTMEEARNLFNDINQQI